mmetsp:Transcript_53683/g.89062  ORF Transcript_53683/g.89062 Transcript_53683/m.89062 type:complete len:106 (-) Transcript_53683:87-404(-)
MNIAKKLKDYGNISSSNMSTDHQDDDVYSFPYQLKHELPLDIITNPGKSNDAQKNTPQNEKQLDFSVLTKVMLPPHKLNAPKNNNVWTFDSILADLQNALQPKRS